MFLVQNVAITELNNRNFIPDSIEELGLLMKHVMDSFYCEKPAVDLITINTTDTETAEILAYILPIIEKCSAVRTSLNIRKGNRKKAYNIITIKDKREFDQFIKIISNEYFDYRRFYTLICTNENIELENFFAKAWKHSLVNFNLIIKFSRLIIRELSNGKVSLSGIDGDIVKELMANFNFTLNILKLSREEERWGVANENGNHTGAIKMVVNKEADFMLGLMALTLLRVKFMDSTTSFISFPFVLITPRGMEFSPFQKLFRPFSFIVWVFLILSFLSGFTLIFVVRKFGSKGIKKNLFIENHRTSYLNMMNVFFGGTLHTLPSKSVARMLLATFILYCLVMRTIYQGLLFKNMQSDDRQQPVMTVDELIENDYVVYMQPVYVEHSKNMNFFSKRQEIKDSEVEYYQQRTLDTSFKGAVTSSLDEVLYFNMQNYKNFTYRVLPEYLYSFNYVIYFQKNSPFLNAFDEKISLFKSAGLIDFWVSKYLNAVYLIVPVGANEPKKLNIIQLQGGFQLWLAGCFVSFIIFMLELFCAKISRRRRRERK